MFDILFIPYRDMYFWNEYGSAVRDLQFLESLLEIDEVSKVTVINRPVSIYERGLNKKKIKFNYPKINIIDHTSFDIFGPLKKRIWTKDCYSDIVEKYIYTHLKDSDNRLIIIDFTPISLIPYIKSEKIIYWYDMIDNFTKHNCYTDKEKRYVNYKYQYVAENYDFISAVSEKALFEIEKRKNIDSVVLPNGVFKTTFLSDFPLDETLVNKYDFGFIGFITDKFDIDFVCELAQIYSIVIYGKFYDKQIEKILKKNGVVIKGPFKYTDVNYIIKTFKIGLLPYLSEKSHDGSPLKLYEYLKYNIPCITSINYEFQNEYVLNYVLSANLDNEIKKISSVSGDENISKSLPQQCFFDRNIKNAFNYVANR
ncbi:glycosyl transferase [Pectobacterium versatile]|uniref:glycosyl transferase n=1 Tax=Pectobacterium versatile TaxID=2488639 RepID=UPI001CD18F18|nr:glycosyl transferase [Pectobacterium versatile]